MGFRSMVVVLRRFCRVFFVSGSGARDNDMALYIVWVDTLLFIAN